jgi:hypothetical protein
MNEIRHHGRELLDQARRERTPDAADRARVLGALMASAALATATSATAAPAVAEKLLTGVSKWLLLAGLAGTVTGGVYLAGHVGAKAPAAAVASAPIASPSPPLAVPLMPKLEAAPVAEEALPVPSNQPDAPIAPRASVARRDTEAPSLEAELSGLQAAHAAYRGGNPARALALIAEHKAHFPKSQLSTERATLEVLSLCRVGRTGDARLLADRLRKNAGNAAALSGLDGSCAAK